MSLHAPLEEADDVAVVWILCEAQAAAVVHELLEFLWLVFAELVDRGLLLLLLNIGILFGFGSAGQALPWQRSLQEIQDDVADCLQIISPRLLVSQVGIETGVPGCSSEVLSVSERNVLAIGALVALGEAEVNDVDCVLGLVIAANQEVVGLDIAVDDSFLVHHLDPLDHLHRNVQDRLQVKLSPAFLELILQTFAKEVHHHHVIHFAIFCLLASNKVQVGHCGLSSEFVDEFGLPEEHDMLGILDSLLNFCGKEVASLPLLHLIDVSKGASAK